jgi:hypothetical protein
MNPDNQPEVVAFDVEHHTVSGTDIRRVRYYCINAISRSVRAAPVLNGRPS